MITALLVGTGRVEETQSLRAQLEAVAQVRAVDETAAAVELLTSQSWSPALGVVSQQWPDQFTRRDVERLLAAAPLARWICCRGPWCESDGRTRDIWPLAVHVSAALFAGRLRRELAVLAGRQPPLPLTAGRDEIFQFDTREAVADQAPPCQVAVRSPDGALGAWLAAAVRIAGHVAWTEDRAAVRLDAVLWDVDPAGPQTVHDLRAARARHRQAAIVAMAALACPQDVAAWQAAGADIVLPKLLPLAELLSTLADALAKRRRVRPPAESPATAALRQSESPGTLDPSSDRAPAS